MNLPGLITVQPDRTEELDALARMVGTCFLEEMWYVTWLEALDELGIGRDRKLEITRAVIRSDYEVTAPYQCVYALPDRAGAANVYLRSELGDVDWTELEEESGTLLAEVLTDEEIDVLGPTRISSTSSRPVWIPRSVAAEHSAVCSRRFWNTPTSTGWPATSIATPNGSSSCTATSASRRWSAAASTPSPSKSA